jgi:hypothetical protein
MKIMADRKWKRRYAGSYKSNDGWLIEKSMDHDFWLVISPEGNIVDSLPTKRKAMEIYG